MRYVVGKSLWHVNLRMSGETFQVFCDELRPSPEGQSTVFREPISMKAMLAVTIWYSRLLEHYLRLDAQTWLRLFLILVMQWDTSSRQPERRI